MEAGIARFQRLRRRCHSVAKERSRVMKRLEPGGKKRATVEKVIRMSDQRTEFKRAKPSALPTVDDLDELLPGLHGRVHQSPFLKVARQYLCTEHGVQKLEQRIVHQRKRRSDA